MTFYDFFKLRQNEVNVGLVDIAKAVGTSTVYVYYMLSKKKNCNEKNREIISLVLQLTESEKEIFYNYLDDKNGLDKDYTFISFALDSENEKFVSLFTELKNKYSKLDSKDIDKIYKILERK